MLVRPASSLWRIEDIVTKVNLRQADLLNDASLEALLAETRPGVVFHLAGDTAGRRWSAGLGELNSSLDSNLKGTLNLVKALHRLDLRPRFIRAGGLSEYGAAPAPFDERARELPLSAYGASQAATTMFLGALRDFLAFPVITLRLASVYGPGSRDSFFLPSLILHCIQRRQFHMTDGGQRWAFIYIDDVVDAFLKAAQSHVSQGEIINIGPAECYTLREIAGMVARKTDACNWVSAGARPAQAGDIPHLHCAISKAREILNWSPVTPLDAGLDVTIAWYRKYLDEPKLAVQEATDDTL